MARMGVGIMVVVVVVVVLSYELAAGERRGRFFLVVFFFFVSDWSGVATSVFRSIFMLSCFFNHHLASLLWSGFTLRMGMKR